MLGIAGSVGAFAGNALHPQVPAGAAAAVETIGTSRVWTPVHLLVAVSILLMTVGLVAVADRLSSGAAAGLARGGAVAAVAGVVVGLVLMAVDGVLARTAAEQALEHGDQVSVALVGFTESASLALVALFNIVFGGVTFVLLGLAATLDGRVPRWPGAVLTAVGAVSIGVGAVQAVLGTTPPALEVMTIITPVLFTVWTAWMCALLARRTGADGPPVGPPPRPVMLDER